MAGRPFRSCRPGAQHDAAGIFARTPSQVFAEHDRATERQGDRIARFGRRHLQDEHGIRPAAGLRPRDAQAPTLAISPIAGTAQNAGVGGVYALRAA